MAKKWNYDDFEYKVARSRSSLLRGYAIISVFDIEIAVIEDKMIRVDHAAETFSRNINGFASCYSDEYFIEKVLDPKSKVNYRKRIRDAFRIQEELNAISEEFSIA